MTTAALLIVVFLLGVVLVLISLISAATEIAVEREGRLWQAERDQAKHEQKKDLAAMYFTSLLMAEEGLSTFPTLDELLLALEEVVDL